MRDAGLQVARLAELPANTEINPKNVAPWKTKNGLVNTVRMPYPGNRNPGRQVVLERASAAELSLDAFTDRAYASRTPHEAFLRPAHLWRQSKAAQGLAQRWASLLATTDGRERFGGNLSQDAYAVLRGERTIESNRDNQLYTLANLMKGLGMTHEDALVRMEKVWNTQLNRYDPDWYDLETALAKVDRVYSRV